MTVNQTVMAIMGVVCAVLLFQLWRFHPWTAASMTKTSMSVRRFVHSNSLKFVAVTMKVLVLAGTLSVGLSAAYGGILGSQAADPGVIIWRISSLVVVFVGTLLAWIFDALAAHKAKQRSESNVAKVTGALGPVISKLARDAADEVSDEEANSFGLGCAEALLRVMDSGSSWAIRTCLYRYDRLVDDETSETKDKGVDRLVRVGPHAGRAAGATPRRKFSSAVAFDRKLIEILSAGECVRYDDLRHGTRQQAEEMGEDPKYAEGALKRSYRSCVSVPVLDQRDELLGMISCDSKSAYAFTHQDVELMQFFAQLVGAGFTIMSTGPRVVQRAGRTSRRNNAVSS